MALTKIKLNTMVTGTLPDANIPDDITIDTAAAVPASGLTGNTLASGVTASSLTSVGTLSSLTLGGDLTLPQKIVHSGDTDTYLSFADNALSLYTGGTQSVEFIYGNVYLKTNDKALIGYNSSGGAKELIKIHSSDVVRIGEGLPVQIGYTNATPKLEWFYDHSNGNDYKANISLAGNDLEVRGSNGTMEFYTGAVDGASSTERMRITSGGYVGIQTVDNSGDYTPQTISAPLHILQKTASQAYGLVVQGNSNANGGRIGIGEADSNFGTRANVIDIGFDSSTDFIWSRTGKEMLIGVNNSEKVRIKTSATIFSGDNLVGIGQGTPTNSPLEVNLTQTNGTAGSSGFAHFGSAGNTDGYIQGISIGYRENNANYRKIAIAARSRGDGATRSDLCLLVDTANDQASATLGDSKLTIDGLTGNVTVPNSVFMGSGSYVVDDHANFGVGAIVSNWGTAYDVLNVGHSSAYWCEVGDYADRGMGWGNNLYHNGSNYKTIYEDQASAITQKAGNIKFYTVGVKATTTNMSSPGDGDPRVTIQNDGATLFGTASRTATGVGGASFDPNSVGRCLLLLGSVNYTSSVDVARFYNDNGEVGDIRTDGSGASFNSNSDYRLKENEVPLSNALTRLNNLKPYRFNFKADENKTLDGFFAHEVQEVVPEAVTGTKDQMKAIQYQPEDEIPEGKEVYDIKEYSTTEIDPQKMDASKLVPLLVAAVQELSAKVTALENA